jgi:hypothetical protein
MWEFNVNNVHVQDVEGVDGNLQPTIRKRVTYMVGQQGPFVLHYKAADFTAAALQADMDKEVAVLRALHDATQQGR